MRIIYTQDLQRKEKKNTRRNEETFLRNVSFQMKNPSLFRNLFFSRLKRSSKSSLLSIQTNPVNALYEFTIGQQEAFFPSPFLDYETWNESMAEYDRIFASRRRVSTAAKYLSSTFVSDEFFQKLNLRKKLINSRDSSSVIIGSLCVEISRVTSTGKEIDNR